MNGSRSEGEIRAWCGWVAKRNNPSAAEGQVKAAHRITPKLLRRTCGIKSVRRERKPKTTLASSYVSEDRRSRWVNTIAIKCCIECPSPGRRIGKHIKVDLGIAVARVTRLSGDKIIINACKSAAIGRGTRETIVNSLIVRARLPGKDVSARVCHIGKGCEACPVACIMPKKRSVGNVGALVKVREPSPCVNRRY